MSRDSRVGWCTRVASLTAVAVLLAASSSIAIAATKTVDLDAQSANGAESKCDLNVLSTFPVKVENVVTNKAVGNAFDFSWKSAGPGGFTSSAATGSEGGVGAKWTWTTNQTVYSFTGSNCENDICFLKTTGPDPLASTCSAGCLNDGATLSVSKGATADEVVLSWTGGTGPYTVYRSSSRVAIDQPANEIGSTSATTYTDRFTSSGIVYYKVRGATCNQRKSCSTNADCNPLNEGSCVSRGPFSVPGRSLFTNDVTVSSASLTSSLVTFFSPPKEVFRVTSTATPGAFSETVSNNSNQPVTVTTEAYPPGCCPGDPATDHKLRCGDTCVDFLTDPDNCGACGNVCGEGTCCSDGACTSLCAAGQTWCNGACYDLQNDNANCGACGNACGEGTCCSGGVCASQCEEGKVWCDGVCVDVQNDTANCGACGSACGTEACCEGGSCVGLTACDEGRTFCSDSCYDLQNDPDHCGACGNVCGEGTCCNGGACVSVCAAGQVWCNGACVDLQNDNASCGACGNACGEGTCCSGGACVGLTACEAGRTFCGEACEDLQNDNDNCGACGNACGEGSCCVGGTCSAFSACEAGRTFCDGLCYDLQNDPDNCGACGNVCDGQSTCSNGVCSPCTGQGGRKDACDNSCVNLNTDPYNCGACGVSCNLSCPSGFTGVCSNGQSCRCVEGTPAPQPPSKIPPPTPPFCQNPNPNPASLPGFCPNPSPSGPVSGFCPNPNPIPDPLPGFCPNPSPSTPVDEFCPNPNPSSSVPGFCPDPPAPTLQGTPICIVNPGETTIPPGASSTICRPGGVVYKEVSSVVSVCGDNIPGPDGTCADGISNVSSGTFMRLVPASDVEIGDAYLTPYAVTVTADTSNDGLIQPGETASFLIRVLNAGPVSIVGAQATLIAPPFDLTDDGISNPVGATVASATASYGTIVGTQPSVDCAPLQLNPASNAVPFQVTLPIDHPGDTARPFQLQFTGTVNGAPFSATVPIALGVADRCDYAAATRDYDGLDGLLSPMARLVPAGDPVPFPTKTFNAGNTRPMKIRALCGGVELRGADVDAPEIVGLSEATRGPIDITTVNLNDDSSAYDPFFRWNDSTKQWIFNLRTDGIGTGVFTMTIRVAGRKEYVTGFELR